MKKIAICIPTYNRAKMLKETCLQIENIARKDNFDIYIYDSSQGMDSEEELKEMIQNENFFYIKLPESTHSSRKLYDIFQNEKMQNQYEYLWILPDYLFFSEHIIDTIVDKLKENWDMLMLDIFDPEKTGDKQYFEPNRIFFEYAWSMTQFGSMILNCSTVLKTANWNYLEDKYLNEECCNFSHVALYFERMIQIPDLHFFHLSVEREEIFVSKYRKNKSEYFNDYLKIWGYRWYKTIHKLPEYYLNKDEAIKKICIYTGNLGNENVADLILRGILNKKSFKEYKYRWHVVSTVPFYKVWIIMRMPHFFVDLVAEYGSVKKGIARIILMNRIKKFSGRYEKIYLYGAGSIAERTADFLDKNGILFEAFVVTALKENKKILKGHEVIEISQLNASSNYGIILALNKANKRQVIPVLHREGYKNLFKAKLV